MSTTSEKPPDHVQPPDGDEDLELRVLLAQPRQHREVLGVVREALDDLAVLMLAKA